MNNDFLVDITSLYNSINSMSSANDNISELKTAMNSVDLDKMEGLSRKAKFRTNRNKVTRLSTDDNNSIASLLDDLKTLKGQMCQADSNNALLFNMLENNNSINDFGSYLDDDINIKNDDKINELFSTVNYYDVQIDSLQSQLNEIDSAKIAYNTYLNYGPAEYIQSAKAKWEELEKNRTDLESAIVILQNLRNTAFLSAYNVYFENNDFDINSKEFNCTSGIYVEVLNQNTVSPSTNIKNCDDALLAAIYMYENGIENSVVFDNKDKIFSAKTSSYLKTLSYMEPEEINLLKYLSNTDRKVEFNKYFEYISVASIQREGQKLAQETIDTINDYYINYSPDYAYSMTLSLLGKKGFVDGLSNFATGVYDFIYADGIMSANQYETMYIISYLQGFYSEEVFKRTISTGFYEIPSSIGNMAPSMVISMIPGLQGLGLSLMGISSAGNSRESGLQNGMSIGSSYLYGVLSGASEATLQYVLGAIPGLSNMDKFAEVPGLLGFITKMFNEGLEESTQAVLDPFLQAISTCSTDGLEFDWNEIIKSGIYGVITAGLLNGGIVVIKGVDYEIKNLDSDSLILLNELISSSSEVTINYSEYVEICKIVGVSPINENNFTFTTFTNLMNSCNNLQISNVISNCSVDSFAFVLSSINYNNYLNCKDVIVSRLNEISNETSTVVGIDNEILIERTGAKEVLSIISYLNSTGNLQISNDLLLNTESDYMNGITTVLLDSAFDYYEEAIDFANSDKASEFLTYRTHTFEHVKDVSLKCLDSAQAITQTLSKLNLNYSSDVSFFEIYVAGLWHDIGMNAGNYYSKGINSNLNKHTKNYDPKRLIETDNGNITRNNHTLNSALTILDNASYFSDVLGLDPASLALTVFAHSKSNSGISNLTDVDAWSFGIELLNACWKEYNEVYYPSNKQSPSFLEMCGKLVDEKGKFNKNYLSEFAVKGLSLRLGDANTSTYGVVAILNQANNQIIYKNLKSGELILNFEEFSNEFNGDSLSIQEFICKEYGISYEKVLTDPETGKYNIVCLDKGNLEIFVDGASIDLSPVTIAFILGENNVKFDSSSTSPDGKYDGLLHEICMIDDSSIVTPSLYNINERIGEIKSGIPSSETGNYIASIDIVFSEGVSNEILNFYKEAALKYYRSNGIVFNYYTLDSSGNAVPIIEND